MVCDQFAAMHTVGATGPSYPHRATVRSAPPECINFTHTRRSTQPWSTMEVAMQMLSARRRLLGGTIVMLVGAAVACSSDKVNSVQTPIATTVIVDSAANNQTAV